jgi:hypothetical protein
MPLANEQDSCREFARNVGREYPERAWISTPFDTWEPNPFYVGPAVPHPYSDEPRDTDGSLPNENGEGQEAENDRYAQRANPEEH